MSARWRVRELDQLCVMNLGSEVKTVYKHVNEEEKRESTRLIMFLTDWLSLFYQSPSV